MDLLTKNSTQSVKNDILKFFNVDMCNSLHANDRIAFVYLCEKLSAKSSKRYFAETFLESYLSIIQSERYQGVLVALLKTVKQIRMRLDEPSQLQKIESFIVQQKSDKNRSQYLKEVGNINIHQFNSLYSLQRRRTRQYQKTHLGLRGRGLTLRGSKGNKLTN